MPVLMTPIDSIEVSVISVPLNYRFLKAIPICLIVSNTRHGKLYKKSVGPLNADLLTVKKIGAWELITCTDANRQRLFTCRK